MDVANWIRTLGLERYETAFRENDVDTKLLPNLTADDLKDLGITSVGHRRQLLEAIAALRLKDTPADDPVRLPLLTVTSQTVAVTFRFAELYAAALVYYLTIVSLLMLGQYRLERRLDRTGLHTRRQAGAAQR